MQPNRSCSCCSIGNRYHHKQCLSLGGFTGAASQQGLAARVGRGRQAYTDGGRDWYGAQVRYGLWRCGVVVDLPVACCRLGSQDRDPLDVFNLSCSAPHGLVCGELCRSSVCERCVSERETKQRVSKQQYSSTGKSLGSARTPFSGPPLSYHTTAVTAAKQVCLWTEHLT